MFIAASMSLTALWLPASVRAADESLDTVLQRAAQYAVRYRQELSSLVAEERYVQEMRTTFGVNITVDGRGTEPVKHRELRSDFLMVRAGDRYAEFRDVFAVDGAPVRDRQDRLTRLFLTPDASREQIVRIAEESARFNIGSVYRNINTPALALVVLEPEQQKRFRFRRRDSAVPALASGWPTAADEPFAAPAGVWVVDYQETGSKTLVRRMETGGDMPASGRIWLDPSTGQVWLTELAVGDAFMRCTIDVRYGHWAAVGAMLVPAEMRERYVNTRDRVTTIGTATYGRVRKFGVQVEEQLPDLR
jgi:hypothetical protein